MRDPKRIDRILKLIKMKWERYPDQRLGQLLMNYVFGNTGGKHTAFIFYLEDDVIERRLKADLGANAVLEAMKKEGRIG